MPQLQSLLQRRPEIPMTLAILQSSMRFASGLLAGLLLATLIGPGDAETTRLDAITAAMTMVGRCATGLVGGFNRLRRRGC
jgi:hypothetical protein